VCETSRFPHFLDSRLIDGGELSASRAGRPLPPGIFLVLISVTSHRRHEIKSVNYATRNQNQQTHAKYGIQWLVMVFI
jgi:hypothetical protein